MFLSSLICSAHEGQAIISVCNHVMKFWISGIHKAYYASALDLLLNSDSDVEHKLKIRYTMKIARFNQLFLLKCHNYPTIIPYLTLDRKLT